MPRTVHYCNVCGTAYSDFDKAEACETQPEPEAKFSVNDHCLVENEATSSIEERYVTECLLVGHEWQYALNEPYKGKNGMLWGVAGPRSGMYAGRCHEEQLTEVKL